MLDDFLCDGHAFDMLRLNPLELRSDSSFQPDSAWWVTSRWWTQIAKLFRIASRNRSDHQQEPS